MANTDHQATGTLRGPRDHGRQPAGWAGKVTGSVDETAPRPAPRPAGRHLRSVAPGSLAASVMAAGLEDVDLGLERLPRRRGGARIRRLVLAAVGLALIVGVGALWQSRGYDEEPSVGTRPAQAAAPAPALAPVDLETLRSSVAPASAAPETAPGPGGLAVSIRPVESNYTVVEGDTLERIAQRYGTTVDALVGMNNLRDRNSLRVGQKLIIP